MCWGTKCWRAYPKRLPRLGGLPMKHIIAAALSYWAVRVERAGEVGGWLKEGG